MATTPYPFVANAVLTASQLNSTFNIPVSAKTASYVLTAADAGTRITMSSASATTITVNTSLFAAGDNLEITNIGAGVCTVTAGTATVSTSGTLALVANAGGTLYFTSAGVSVFIASGVAASASGLTLISATTIGTTVSTVTVTGCFSSTYDNYKVVINGGIGSINQIGILMTLGSNASGVQGVGVGADYGSAAVSADAANNIAAFEWAGQASTGGIYMSGDIIAPNLAKYSYGSFSGSRFNNNVYVVGAFYEIVNNTQFTAFTLSLNQGTLTGGTIRVYGYANS